MPTLSLVHRLRASLYVTAGLLVVWGGWMTGWLAFARGEPLAGALGVALILGGLLAGIALALDGVALIVAKATES